MQTNLIQKCYLKTIDPPLECFPETRGAYLDIFLGNKEDIYYIDISTVMYTHAYHLLQYEAKLKSEIYYLPHLLMTII